ncbi:MAG: outer membrane lipoprotein-sorting protein, partial [Vulcanimicrobiota bacterium]
VADVEVYTPMEGKGETQLTLSSKDKIIFKKPNKLKIDSVIQDPGGSLDGKQVTIIRDGVQRWMYVSAGQYPVKKGPDEPYATLNLPPNIQIYPQESDRTFKVMGKEKIKNVDAIKIEITDESTKEVQIIYVDPIKKVPLKMEIVTIDPKNPEKKETRECYYKDFKKLKDGRWFPFVIEMKQEGKATRMVVYKALSVNVGIDEHLFEPMKKFVK